MKFLYSGTADENIRRDEGSGKQVSIFNFTAHGLRAQGLAYPLYDFTTWWQGTQNSCTGTSFTIEVEGEYLVFMSYS